MAKYKPAGKSAAKKSSTRGVIPCLLVIVGGIVLMSLLFYAMLQSAAN
ncbi:MAG: hypothetical protein R2762_13755 [Bryobacteraceae bacterium]